MTLDLSQYVEPLLTSLDNNMQTLSIPYICNTLTVTPNTAKLILKDIAEKKQESINAVMCLTGIKNGIYTIKLCSLESIEKTRQEFSLVVSIHHYSITPKSELKIADGICNSIYSVLQSREIDVDISSRSHIVNHSISIDRSVLRTFVAPNMQSRSPSTSSPTNSVLKAGAPKSSVKILFAKAPTKKKEEIKKEEIKKEERKEERKEGKEEDLFDDEVSDDEIARGNRLRRIQIYADSDEEDDQVVATPIMKEKEEKEEEEEEVKEKKSIKREKDPVNGAMDIFAKRVAIEPKKENASLNGMQMVQKEREVIDEEGFIRTELYYEEEECNPIVSSSIEIRTSSMKLTPLAVKTVPTPPKKPVAKEQGSIKSFFSKKINSHRIISSSVLKSKYSLVMNASDKLSALRSIMKDRNIDAYVIPSQDQHMSEYVPECYQRRSWISGFTGSSGTAVITNDKALLWTDSRYFLQALQQLPSFWTLMKQDTEGYPKLSEWLVDSLNENNRVGVDATLVSSFTGSSLSQALNKKSIILVSDMENLVDNVWTDKPATPCTPIIYLSNDDAGETIQSKIDRIRVSLTKSGCNTLILTVLADICWLLNLRGSDIPYNPYVYSYVVIDASFIHLFIQEGRIKSDDMCHFDGIHLRLHDYASFYEYMCDLKKDDGVCLGVDVKEVNYRLTQDTLHLTPVIITNPVSLMKSIKNEKEISNIKSSFLRDSVAMAHFLSWVEMTIDDELNEAEVAEESTRLRQIYADSYGDSFEPIVGCGSNAAIVHYKPERETAAKLCRDVCILMDTGGQYHWGTTDITRTIVVPSMKSLDGVSSDYRSCYTAVLKGHIALERVVFPEGTRGVQLDVLARRALWELNLDYGHGTGHGVGYFSGVHEGPESISCRTSQYAEGIKSGMVLTDEPGYYDEEKGFGVRIENTLHILVFIVQ